MNITCVSEVGNECVLLAHADRLYYQYIHLSIYHCKGIINARRVVGHCDESIVKKLPYGD